MKGGIFRVYIGNSSHTPEQQQATDGSWQRTLKTAKNAEEKCFCRCPSKGVKPLSIHRRQEGQEFYWLARYAHTGHFHHQECRFYAPAPIRSGLQGYVTKVVDEDGDGFKIRLSVGLKAADQGNPSGVDSVQVGGVSRSRQRAMSLLGLLHFLWGLGRLNIWFPKMADKRHWGLVAHQLFEAANSISCNSTALSEHLLVGVFNGNDYEQANKERVDAAVGENRRLLLVGMLLAWDKAMSTGGLPDRLPFVNWAGLPYTHMVPSMWDMVESKFKLAWSAWRAGRKVVAIAQVELDKSSPAKPAWNVVGMAIQEVTDEFIPVDSDYERQIAELLVKEKRAFEKPLRYDASKDEVFPDFILLDMGSDPYPMEVFGRTDEKYEDREKEKREYYKTNFGNAWWCWKASSKEPIPDLPAPAAAK